MKNSTYKDFDAAYQTAIDGVADISNMCRAAHDLGQHDLGRKLGHMADAIYSAVEFMAKDRNEALRQSAMQAVRNADTMLGTIWAVGQAMKD